MLLGLALSAVIAASPTGDGKPFVPWFVPRTLSLGVFINPPVAAPHVRLNWEAAIISQPRNDFIWLVSLGSAVGGWVPPPMTAHYQHVLLGGFGYRSDRDVLHWGFHVVTGPLWYRAFYAPGGLNAAENRVVGYIEGRLQLGARIHGPLKLAAYFGYASPFVFNQRFPGNTYTGGVDVGVVVDWR